MQCPTCQTKLSAVKQTRQTTEGYSRYRECYNGHTFKTVEVPVPYWTTEQKTAFLLKAQANSAKKRRNK